MVDITSPISNWFAQPENKAAVLQFGLSLMQPPQWGQRPGAQIASAVGEGAEAQQRNIATRAGSQAAAQKLAIDQQEADASMIRARNAGGLSMGALFNADRKSEEKWGDFLDDALKAEAFDADQRDALLADNGWLEKKTQEFQLLYPGMARRKGGKATPSVEKPGSGTSLRLKPPPKPGYVEDGFRFKGGNPNDKNSWEPV